MFRTLKSNSPLSAPRDDTALAVYGNRAKSDFLPIFPTQLARESEPAHGPPADQRGLGGNTSSHASTWARAA